ncbi:hypothetical protein GF386_06805, partial [Candidatus Pacearchaeota archaeon]|nr:hypothetical protein [Candidatus Pacearchaeota archaeon]
MIKISVWIFIVFLFLITLFFVERGSAVIEKDRYVLGEKVKFNLRGYGSYKMKVITPSTSYIKPGINDIILFEPKEVGNYEIEIKSGKKFEEYFFEVIGDNETNSDEYLNETYNQTEVLNNQTCENKIIEDKIIIGKPVRWKNKFNIAGSTRRTKFDIPDSNNISVYKLGINGREKIRDFSVRNYSDYLSVILNDVQGNIEIEYYTEAPKKQERIISNTRKEVKVYSDIEYENVTAFTEINEMTKDKSAINVYWKEEDRYLDFEAFDMDNNSLLDYIEWSVPHLSNQTFEISIEILNIQSYPMVGGNWSVLFNATGRANLTIKAVDGTSWSSENENFDLKFLEIKCGQDILDYEWRNGIFIQDYECNETGFEVSKVLTSGKHVLEFCFGDYCEKAYNYAGAAVKNVQKGSESFSGGSTDVTISQVNVSSSFLVFSYTVSNSGTRPDNSLVRGAITSPTNIHFERAATGGTIDLFWYVVEFESGVEVQNGTETSVSSSTTNVGINAVNISSSFPITSFENDNSGMWGADDEMWSRITNSTNLEARLGSGTDEDFSWQVVDYQGAEIQNGTFSLSGTSNDVDINEVNLSKAFVYANWYTAASDEDSDDFGIFVNFTNSTRIHFERENNGGTFYISWYVVEFTGYEDVQSGLSNFGNSDLVKNIPIDSINESRAIAFLSGNWKGGKTSYGSQDDPGVVWFTANITNSTNLRLERAITGSSSADVQWFVVEFAPEIDEQSPEVIINFPENKTYNSSDFPLNFNVSLNEPGSLVQYSLDEGVNNITMQTDDNLSYNHTNSSIADGSYVFRVYANDSSGNRNYSESVVFSVDTTPPLITVSSPEIKNYSIGSMNFNITLDEDAEFCNYTLNNGINHTMSTTDNRNFNATNSSIGDGQYTVRFFCRDFFYNLNNTETRNFGVDTVYPKIDYGENVEDNNTNFTRDWIFVNVSVTEDNEDNITFLLYNQTCQINRSVFYNIQRAINWTGLEDGKYYYNVAVVDISGNKNFTETRIIKLDNNGPVVSIIEPQDKKTFATNISIPLNYTISDNVLGYKNCWWNIDNGENNSINCGENTTFNVSGDGQYVLNFYSNDSLNNIGYTNSTFAVSTLGPAMTLHYPEDNLFLNYSLDVEFNYTPSDPDGVDTCILYGNWSGDWHANKSDSNIENNSVNSFFVNISDGNYFWNVLCNDSAGLESFAIVNLTFSIDTFYPEVSYGSGTKSDGAEIVQDFIYVNVTVNETNFANITYLLYNETSEVNKTIYYGLVTDINWTGLSRANITYYYNVSVADLASNKNTTLTYSIKLIDIYPPNASLLSPENDSYNSTTSHNLTVNASDDLELDNASLFIYNETGDLINETFSEISGTEAVLGIVYEFLYDGIFHWFYRIFDIAGNVFTTGNNTITIDTINPDVDFGEGTLDSELTVSQDFIYVNVSVEEVNEDEVIFGLYNDTGIVNVTSLDSDIREFNWTNLGDGDYYYNVTVVDKVGRKGYTPTRALTLDTSPVTVNINYPSNSSIIGDVTPILNLTVGGAADSVYYTVNSGKNNFSLCSDCSGNVTEVLHLEEGSNEVIVYANDSLGNLGSNVSSFIIDLNFSYYDDFMDNTSIRKYEGVEWQEGNLSLGSSGAVLKNIQKGSEIFSGSSHQVSIDSVDLNSSMLIFSYSTDTEASESFLVWGNISNSTTIDFGREGSSGSIEIVWYVVEFKFGVSVQRGTFTQGTTTNTPISAVNVSQSFPTMSFTSYSSTTWGSDDAVRARLTDNSNLETYAGANINNILAWQVIDYEGLRVQNGTFDMTGATYDEAIDEVNLNKSFIITTWSTSSSNIQCREGGLLSNFTDSTSIHFERDLGDDTLNVAWYVVEFTGDEKVYTGTENFGGSDTEKDVTISSVDPTRSVAFLTDSFRGGKGSDTVDYAGSIWFTANITNSTSLHLKRSTTAGGDTSEVQWFVVEFSSGKKGNFTILETNTTRNIMNITNVTWNESGTDSNNNISIEVSVDNGQNWYDAVNGQGINGFSEDNSLVYRAIFQSNGSKSISLLNVNITWIENFPPNISILYPLNESYKTNVSTINYTYSDDTGEGYCWYSNSSGSWNSSSVSAGDNFTEVISREGSNEWRVYCNDTEGNENSSYVSFFKDTVFPEINFTNPTEISGVNRSRDRIFINVSISETNPSNITYLLYNETGEVNKTVYSMSDENSNNTINFTGLDDGYYFYNVTIFDILSNKNYTETRTIRLDTVFPLISYSEGTEKDNSAFSRNWIYVNVTVNETNFANITFSLFNSSGLVNKSLFTNSVYEINWTGLNEGEYYYNVTIVDMVSLSNFTKIRSIALDNNNPMINYSYGVESSGVNKSQNWIFVNVTVNETNPANVTFFLYNTSGIIENRTYPDMFKGVNLLNNSYGSFESISATSYANGWGPDNLVDNYYTGGVGYAWSGAGGVSGDVNITINLTEKYSFDVIEIFEGRINTFQSSPRNISVYVSDDGINWDFVANKILFGSVPDTRGQHDVISFAEQNKRYIKIEFIDNWGDGNFIGCKEIRVYKNTTNLANLSSTSVHDYPMQSSSGNSVNQTRNNILGESESYWNANFSDYVNITWDFGSYYEIDSLEWYGISGNSNYYPGNYSIWIYRKGIGYSEISRGKFQGGNNGFIEKINFTRVNASKLRLSIRDGYGSNITSNEIRVWKADSGIKSSYRFTELQDDMYYYNVTFYDKAGLYNYTETRNIRLDTNSLFGNLTTPENNTYTNDTNQNLTVNASDSVGLDNATLYVYNETGDLINETFSEISGTEAVLGIVYEFLYDGIFHWFYRIFDIAGNVFTTGNNTITIDTVYPGINYTIGTESSGVNKNQNWIFINVSVNESNFANITYYLYNDTSEVNKTTYYTLIESINFTNLDDDLYYYNVSITDRANQRNSTETRTIGLDDGYPLIWYDNGTEESGVNKSQNWIFVKVSISETNPSNITYLLYNETGEVNKTIYSMSDENSNNTINFTNLIDGVYYYNVTVFDTLNQANTTETRVMKLDTSIPRINLESPIDYSGDNNGDIIFEYNVSSEVKNCSLVINGQINQTNSTVLVNTTQNFYIYNLDTGNYKWNINCTDYAENTGNSTFREFDIILTTNFNGDTTDLSQVNTSNIISFTLENTLYGKIIYNESIDLSGGANINNLINISYNFINVNSESEPRLNKSATIEFYNLSYYEKPLILRNGFLCSDICHFNYYNGNLSFNVSYFTNYSTSENSNLSIWDETDPEGGGKIRYVNNQVIFYSNYTNKTSGKPINQTDVNCNISFNISGGWTASEEMQYNQTSSLYEYNRSFVSDGIFNWNVSCNGSSEGFEPLELLDNVNISLDTVYPGINYTIGTESSGVNKNQNWIFINVSVNETNFANITYYLYNDTSEVNKTTYYTLIESINFTNLNDSLYYYNVSVVDFANQRNSTETRTIRLDTVNPNATLISPENDTYTNITGQNMTVNASDSVGLDNASLFVYNETGDLINETFSEISGTEAVLGIVYEFLYDGIFHWFYRIFDIAGNVFTTGNNTITIDTTGPVVDLISPGNDSVVSESRVWFVGNFSDVNELKNSSLYIWNSSQDLVNTSIVNISGSINSTNVSFVLPYYDVFYWNYYVCDNLSNCDWNSSNYTLNYENQQVGLDLLYPLENINVTQYDFFNVTLNVSCLSGYCGNVNVSLDPVNWWNLNWLKRKEINISSSANLADFPAYLNISKEENM